jgi:hypothetical protein
MAATVAPSELAICRTHAQHIALESVPTGARRRRCRQGCSCMIASSNALQMLNSLYVMDAERSTIPKLTAASPRCPVSMQHRMQTWNMSTSRPSLG